MSAKIERQFIDTNILIYAHDLSAGRKHQMAKKLVADLWDSARGCLSVQVLQEFYVTITEEVTRPIPDDAAMGIISDLSKWTIHAPDADDVLEAIRLRRLHLLSFLDALILCSAEKLGCSILWTEDLNHGQMFGRVQALNPFQEG